jgi:hypothetical protein
MASWLSLKVADTINIMDEDYTKGNERVMTTITTMVGEKRLEESITHIDDIHTNNTLRCHRFNRPPFSPHRPRSSTAHSTTKPAVFDMAMQGLHYPVSIDEQRARRRLCQICRLLDG